jgi:hypothetical protein
MSNSPLDLILNLFADCIRHFLSTSSLNTVKIWVGDKKEHWVLPEDLLCEKIDYFRAAFKGQFKESTSKELHLKTDDPEAFGFLVDWILKERLEFGCFRREQQMPLCKLYILADKLAAIDLCDDVLDQLSTLNESLQLPLDSKVVDLVYTKTIEKSALRAELVCQAVAVLFGGFEKDMKYWAAATSSNAEFNLEVSQAIRKHMTEDAEDCDLDLCDTHDGRD